MTKIEAKDSMPREQPKDFVLSLRIPMDLLKEIDECADKEHLGRSDYIRKAISDAISVSEVLRQAQTFLISPEMIQIALEHMDEFDIENFAILSLKSGRNFLKLYLQHSLHSTVIKKYLPNKQTILSGIMEYLSQSILGPTGQHWVDRIHFSWEGNKVILTGIHSLGLNFSKFLYYYFFHLFEIFNYTCVQTEIILKEERLKLIFQGDAKEFDVSSLMV
jgi:hypothetical protein